MVFTVEKYKIKCKDYTDVGDGLHFQVCGSCNWRCPRLFCVDFGGDKPKLCANCLIDFIRKEGGRVVFPPISKKTAKDRKVYR